MAKITLFQHVGFTGNREDLSQAEPRLRRLDNHVSSCVVEEGTWILYGDPNYGGHSVKLTPGRYPNITSVGMLNDHISSVRPLSDVMMTFIAIDDSVEVSLNGDTVFESGILRYNQPHKTLELTDMLSAGANTLHVRAANGPGSAEFRAYITQDGHELKRWEFKPKYIGRNDRFIDEDVLINS